MPAASHACSTVEPLEYARAHCSQTPLCRPGTKEQLAEMHWVTWISNAQRPSSCCSEAPCLTLSSNGSARLLVM